MQTSHTLIGDEDRKDLPVYVARLNYFEIPKVSFQGIASTPGFHTASFYLYMNLKTLEEQNPFYVYQCNATRRTLQQRTWQQLQLLPTENSNHSVPLLMYTH
jgi:hypothetical protein